MLPRNLLFAWLLGLALSLLCGCSQLEKIPPGAQIQSSTFGLKLAPQSPDGAPLTIGSHTLIITTAQPADAGPNVNRVSSDAPGVHLRSTVATGPVGDQLQAAGGTEAINSLLRPGESSERSAAPPTVLGPPLP